ncbi:hypothetical protein LINGRAHAP2_LOCUS1247 [Linum grandiflorum]
MKSSSSRTSELGHTDERVQPQSSNSMQNQRSDFGTQPTQRDATGDERPSFAEDKEAMALYSRMTNQKEEIQMLRKQIAAAGVKELQLLSEKYAMERKFSELRRAIDDKQNEAVTAALNELVRRKVDLEENFKLAHNLKVVDDERYIFVSSILGLLAEHEIWPHALNASSLSNSVKHLHNQLQWKIKSSHEKIRELGSTMGSQTESGNHDRDHLGPGILTGQFHDPALGHHTNPHNTLEPRENMMGHMPQKNIAERASSMLDNDRQPQPRSNNSPEFEFNRDSHGSSFGAASSSLSLSFNKGLGDMRGQEMVTKDLFLPSNGDHEMTSSVSDDGPGIDGFQIVGDAAPGERLLGCGYPVRGTSLCMFQWVRHLDDGTRQYIDGATNPEYIVTADDVDKVIAVECIPMDDQGRQGELVRLFANGQRKIKCDQDMQSEIDTYIANGEATFSVLLLMDTSENWEPIDLVLQRSGYRMKSKISVELVFAEKFSKDLSLKIPSGSTQFVLMSSDGTSYPLSTSTVRMRETLVLTMRMFQSKALDDKRKGRA